ncbi:hypothetical protein [Amycolatopsis taiwanensis]|uniref:hypothetical protein n=1 Tax=Amycolatopsis taiwanensis TaxID=342230 RepID=UPI000484F85D|nr:hypothetical protein [Amycolatopsis taiwanensis]
MRHAISVIDTLLDGEHVPAMPQPGWTRSFQEFADFLRNNPTDREVKRRRTHITFIADLPSLGIFREVLHEKLSDPRLRWENNDLTDMMYLSAGAAYCDHIVGERRHIAYITNATQRLQRHARVHRTLTSLTDHL